MSESWVEFRIADVYVPEPAQILVELHGKELLRGKIIDLSDADGVKDAFAVVQVQGLLQPVVVPVKKLTRILCDSECLKHPFG